MGAKSISIVFGFTLAVSCLVKRHRGSEPASFEATTILTHQETLDFLDRGKTYQIVDTILIRTSGSRLEFAGFPRLASAIDDMITTRRYVPIKNVLGSAAAVSHAVESGLVARKALADVTELPIDGFFASPGLYPVKGFWDARIEILEVWRLVEQFPETSLDISELGRMQKQIEELERLAKARVEAQAAVQSKVNALEQTKAKELAELERLQNELSEAGRDHSLVDGLLRTDEELQATRTRLIKARQGNIDRAEQEIRAIRRQVADIERQAQLAEETGVIAQLQIKADQIKQVWQESGTSAAIDHLRSFLGEGYKSGVSAKGWHNIMTMPLYALSALSSGSPLAMARVVAEVSYNSDAMWHVVKGSERLVGIEGGQAFEAAAAHLADIPSSSPRYPEARALLDRMKQADQDLEALAEKKVRATDSPKDLAAVAREAERVNQEVAGIFTEMSNTRLLGDASLVANRGFRGTVTEAAQSLLKRLQL